MSRAHKGIIARGDKSSNPIGTLTFVGFRVLDPLFQYGFLTQQIGTGLLTTLGARLIAYPAVTTTTGLSLLDSLQLSPYRLALLGMCFGAVAKQSYWKVFIGQENTGVGLAAMVSAFNFVMATANNALFLWTATSPAVSTGEGSGSPGWPGLPLALGSALYVAGITVELVSELQRKAFKSKPENQGKVYKGGLFGLARHINYGGFTLWRVGYALAAGGWAWALFTGGFTVMNFLKESIPEIDEYCEQRYADSWHDYKNEVPYKLLPWVI